MANLESKSFVLSLMKHMPFPLDKKHVDSGYIFIFLFA